MLYLLTIFFVSAAVGYFILGSLLQAPKSNYFPPITPAEVRILKDNTNRGTEDNIDNLYLELGRIEVELLLEKDL